ncbi:cupin domain-containing protein [Spirosoma utsteinense]|uniref:Quercetin dioxygenase-like cupin family protein n=1 Tax=Spirosoma utsteinense TaxID=2585773 RepID=A0ABR6WB46_9BACT|nr:cupin domain-containing protein [Spirosoma utsteinense]MBC3788504.1 quercetin dioxygenase-like cupin family protein [Spirosoma utsteinense]MBC3793182.1 quercetin dioxygenase-like cupin family protein [Spirosoma utsteinense]
MRNRKVFNQTGLPAFLFLALCLTITPPLRAQKTANDLRKQQVGKTGLVVYKTGEPAALPYDFGKVRFLVDSAATNGAWSLVEITEQPGYKTPMHRHNSWDESFYVLEGTLTAKVADSVYTLPKGSYILIPRGTPHGQANLASVPVKLLLSITPSGFERHIKDRVELFKTVKPEHSEFATKMDSLRKKNAKYIEILGSWDAPKR